MRAALYAHPLRPALLSSRPHHFRLRRVRVGAVGEYRRGRSGILEPVGAFGSENICRIRARDYQEKASPAWSFVCVPDTVDPRGPKGK
jgi:hypothetical protein